MAHRVKSAVCRLFISQQNLRNALRRSRIRLLQNMTIKIQRRTGLGMPQSSGDREDICAAIDQNAGHRVAEGVGVDMPQPMPPAELIQLAIYAVRMNRASIFSSEYIVCFLPAVSHTGFRPLLIRCILQEKIHRFRRDFDVPLTFWCFGRLCVGVRLTRYYLIYR